MECLDSIIDANKTIKRVNSFLYILCQLRYATFHTLKLCNQQSIDRHIVTKPFLLKLQTCNLVQIQGDSYSATPEAIKHLTASGFNTRFIQKRLRAEPSTHTLLIADCIMQLKPDLIFYGQLKDHDLEPDACLVFLLPEGYKLALLEVEATDKPHNYLLSKRDKYLSAGQDPNTYLKWWKKWSDILGLSYPEMDSFSFSVICFGEQKFDERWWEWKYLSY